VIRNIFARLRPEEAIYGLFFFALFLAGIFRGEWTFQWYADRFTYFFGILAVLFGTWRLHLRMADMETLDLAVLREEGIRGIRVFRDIFNLYMCLAMYSSLTPILNELPAKDQLIIDFEQSIFGRNPLLMLEPLIHPTLTKAMVVFYLSFFLYPPILVMYLLIRKKSTDMRQFTVALSIALFIGYSSYLVIPAVGPATFQAGEFTVSLWKATPSRFQDTLRAVIDLNRTPKDCFPSMHVCISMVCLLSAWQFSRKLFWLFLPGITGLFISTMYLRYHYVSDVIAGAALAWVAVCLGPVVREKWESLTGHWSAPLPMPPDASSPKDSEK
jgi:membrane-associated phospholipid phosphatase